MRRVIALHGAAGSGNTTLIRLIQEYFGTDYFAIQEDADELLATPSRDDDQVAWQQQTTAIGARDNVTQTLRKTESITSDHIHSPCLFCH